MTNGTPTFVIDVDVTNPGQFFACCGILELSHRLWPRTEAWFDDDQFSILTENQDASLRELQTKLIDCAVSEAEFECSTIVDANNKPVSLPKVTPLVLGSPFNLRLSWWVDESARRFTELKMWSAHQSSTSIFSALHQALRSHSEPLDGKVFSLRIDADRRFGFDARSAWNGLGTGFSLNTVGIGLSSYSLTDLFAAIGLQTFKPACTDGVFQYYTWPQRMPLAICRTLATSYVIPTQRSFAFTLHRRGKFKDFNFAKEL